MNAIDIGGVLAPTMLPIDSSGTVLFDAILPQVQTIAQIEGINGVAVNTSQAERKLLSRDQRVT